MSPSSFPVLLAIASIFHTVESSPALPAIQYLHSRDPYQGGWPLALTGTNSNSCPTEASVQCTSKDVNPECCPSGQTCFWGASQFTNYCCPTGADCNTAVLNFPRCAKTTWNMFINDPAGFFCCEPGAIGVVPSAGKSGGVCEPNDQVVPASLLATLVSQVGAPTPTPTSAGTGNATTTETGVPAETNPNFLPSSASGSGGSSGSFGGTGFQGWSKSVKIGVVAAILAAVVALTVVGSICRRRSTKYGEHVGNLGEYDEFRNRVPGYISYPNAEAFEYRRAERMAENNVTVNVVQGDMQHI